MRWIINFHEGCVRIRLSWWVQITANYRVSQKQSANTIFYCEGSQFWAFKSQDFGGKIAYGKCLCLFDWKFAEFYKVYSRLICSWRPLGAFKHKSPYFMRHPVEAERGESQKIECQAHTNLELRWLKSEMRTYRSSQACRKEKSCAKLSASDSKLISAQPANILTVSPSRRRKNNNKKSLAQNYPNIKQGDPTAKSCVCVFDGLMAKGGSGDCGNCNNWFK